MSKIDVSSRMTQIVTAILQTMTQRNHFHFRVQHSSVATVDFFSQDSYFYRNYKNMILKVEFKRRSIRDKALHSIRGHECVFFF